jgi:hypothetical protein
LFCANGIGCGQAWFRELPEGLLDVFTPPQVMECKSEEESVALVRLLPTTQASLLDWAVNLMADVVQQEAINKMNSHNIAMVFAPNMTQVTNQPTNPPLPKSSVSQGVDTDLLHSYFVM